MNVLSIELRKEKRTGVIPVLLAVGVLGAACRSTRAVTFWTAIRSLPWIEHRNFEI